jgi:RNA polymerase sigma-70 factor (ECF subfamily)
MTPDKTRPRSRRWRISERNSPTGDSHIGSGSPRIESIVLSTREADSALVERTLRGDLRAFEGLVERHRDVVFRVAARIAGPDEAADVSQDAFLRAFHRLSSYKGEAPFRSWLLRIAHNAAVNSATRKRARPLDPRAETSEDTDHSDSERRPAESLERRERQERLQLKLGALRPSYRSLVVLRDLEGLSYEEIAELLEMPIGSVKGRLHRARGELVELLRNNTYDWELPT